MIYVSSSFQWDKLNDQVKRQYGLLEQQKAFCFKNLSHGLFDTAHALAQFYPHKKKIVFLKGNSSSIPSVVPRFYKLAFSVTVLTIKDHVNLEDVTKQIPDDALFVAYSQDHAITGEILNYSHELNKYLNEKKIISIQISHHNHLFHSFEMLPFSIYLMGFGEMMSIGIAGERVKLLNMLSPELDWDHFDFDINKLKRDSQTLDLKFIQAFEASCLDFSEPYFRDPNILRVADRAVLVLKDVNGDTFCHELANELQKPLSQLSTVLSTTQACFWPQIKPFKSWWDSAPDEEILGRIVLIHKDLLKNHEILNKSRAAYLKAKNLSQW